jgi:hypothetical protein
MEITRKFSKVRLVLLILVEDMAGPTTGHSEAPEELNTSIGVELPARLEIMGNRAVFHSNASIRPQRRPDPRFVA